MASLDFLPFSLSPQQVQVGLLLSLCVSSWLVYLRRHSRLPYPPGPAPGNLLSGNLGDLPQKRAWETYHNWAEKYNSMFTTSEWGLTKLNLR